MTSPDTVPQPAPRAGEARPACAACPYWSALEVGHYGECRRHAPIMQNGEIWTETSFADWCGDHPGFPAYLASLNPSTNPSTPPADADGGRSDG